MPHRFLVKGVKVASVLDSVFCVLSLTGTSTTQSVGDLGSAAWAVN